MAKNFERVSKEGARTACARRRASGSGKGLQKKVHGSNFRGPCPYLKFREKKGLPIQEKPGERGKNGKKGKGKDFQGDESKDEQGTEY